jgi:hypothetical protein
MAAEILWTPSAERRITTNAWAFLHWLGLTRNIVLADWAALARWSQTEPAGFGEAMRAFGGEGDPAVLAARLLFLDLRPDDKVLALAPYADVAISTSPPAAAALLPAAAAAGATVLIVHSPLLDEAVRLGAGNADLSALRTLVAIGGPMSPATRRRIYRAVKSDVLLLAAARARVWGDPLDPVLAHPQGAWALGRTPNSASLRL